jgi:hypothetical protein
MVGLKHYLISSISEKDRAMAKASKQGTQKKGGNAGGGAGAPPPNTTPTPEDGVQQQKTAAPGPAAGRNTFQRGRTGSRNSRSRIGGTAVPGAKSTLPKETPATNNPQQQQAESYNRTMRRRMEQLGTGPTQQSAPAEQQRKRLEKRRRRTEERRQEVKRVAARGPSKIALGRRNVYFLIGVVVLIVAVIVVALLIHGFK